MAKHHQAYVDNLNKAIDGTPNAGATLEDLVARAEASALPYATTAEVTGTIHFSGESMAPAGKGGNPSAALAKTIDTAFGSFESFKEIRSGRHDTFWQRMGMVAPTGRWFTGHQLHA